MGKEVTVTIVDGADDWRGIYFDDELKRQNHNPKLEELDLSGITIREKKYVEYDMQKLGLSELPENLSHLQELSEFAEKVEENLEFWEERLIRCIQEANEDYIFPQEVSESLSIGEGYGEVLLAMFSRVNIRNQKTPIGNEPIVEIDYENSGCGKGPPAYGLR